MTARKPKPQENAAATPTLPGSGQATEALGTLTTLEQSIDPMAPLTARQRAAMDKRRTNLGEGVIEIVSQIVRERGGTLLDVTFDSDTADATLAYAHAFRPVAQRCDTVGDRVGDDVRQRVDGVIDRVQVVIAAIRKAAKKDPTYVPLLSEIDAQRPTAPRKTKGASTPVTTTAPTTTATAVTTVPAVAAPAVGGNGTPTK